MALANPRGLADFLRRPTRAEWNAELAAGWAGPDGSSWSFDSFLGALIGRTGWSYDGVDLAANRHDWYYRLGRRLHLPEAYRKAADRWYRDRLVSQVAEQQVRLATLPIDLIASVLKKAERWSGLRYRALRWFGRAAWRKEPRPPGGWPRRPHGRKVGARQWDRARRKAIDAQWAAWAARQTENE